MPWIRCHGRGGRRLGARCPRLDELALRRDLTALRVDEEQRHSIRRTSDAWSARPRGCSTPTCAAAAPPSARGAPTASICAQLAPWATAPDVDPPSVTTRVLRRYAAALSERGVVARRPSPASSPRCARCFRHAARARRSSRQNPADLVPAPEARRRKLPRVLKADEVAALLDRIPATTPLERARPRDVRARLRVRAARRGARRTSTWARSTSTPRSCASRARAARRGSSRSASRRTAR